MDLELADRVVLATDACKGSGLAGAAALIAMLTGRVAHGLKSGSANDGQAARRAASAVGIAHPGGRTGTPEEFLAPDRASYVNGAIVPMDGASNPVA